MKKENRMFNITNPEEKIKNYFNLFVVSNAAF